MHLCAVDGWTTRCVVDYTFVLVEQIDAPCADEAPLCSGLHPCATGGQVDREDCREEPVINSLILIPHYFIDLCYHSYSSATITMHFSRSWFFWNILDYSHQPHGIRTLINSCPFILPFQLSQYVELSAVVIVTNIVVCCDAYPCWSKCLLTPEFETIASLSSYSSTQFARRIQHVWSFEPDKVW